MMMTPGTCTITQNSTHTESARETERLSGDKVLAVEVLCGLIRLHSWVGQRATSMTKSCAHALYIYVVFENDGVGG